MLKATSAERRVDAVVAADADDLAVEGRDEGDPVVVVDVREPVDVPVAQLAQRREEPQVDGLRRLPAVEVADAVGVVGRDGPDVRDGAVPEDDVRLPLDRGTGGLRRDRRSIARCRR